MREARGSAVQPDWLFPRLRRACDNRGNNKQGEGAMPRRKPDPAMSPEAVEQNAVAPEDRWLPPRATAAVLGVSEKWLAAAREGRKGVEGPPFRKLGTGKTSPVRYNLARLREWIESFPEIVDLAGRQSSLRSFADFQGLIGTSMRALEERWLFALDDGKPVDFFQAINEGLVEHKPAMRYRWLTPATWLLMEVRQK
jgi:hypothetical protein